MRVVLTLIALGIMLGASQPATAALQRAPGRVLRITPKPLVSEDMTAGGAGIALSPAKRDYGWSPRWGWAPLKDAAVLQTHGAGRIVKSGSGPKEVEIIVDHGSVCTSEEQPMPPEGEVVWQADLSDTSGWRWDGEGAAEHLDGGVLRIVNTKASVYWADGVFQSPVLFDMQLRTGDEKCRAILFFMAEGMGGEDIFGWQRPAAFYGDYAYENTMRLYTVGLVREGCGTENNFRFLGGVLPEHLQILRVPPAELTDEQKPLYRQAFADFQPYSIPSTAADGYVLGQWQRVQVLVAGGLVRVWADGKLLHEVTDPQPLTSGRLGFRNFAAGTAIEVRDLRAIRPNP